VPEDTSQDDLEFGLAPSTRTVTVANAALRGLSESPEPPAPPEDESSEESHSDDSFAEKLDKFYKPLALLAMSILAMAVWSKVHVTHGVLGSAVFFFLVSSITAIKAAILSCAAWWIAGKLGGNFGSPLPMILRIASLVVALDACSAWLVELMIHTGALSVGGEGPIRSWVVHFICLVIAGYAITQYYFGAEEHEARIFGTVVAIGNWVVTVVIVVALFAIVGAMHNARNSARAALTAPPPPSPVTVAAMNGDMAMRNRISGGMGLVNAHEWKESEAARGAAGPVFTLLDDLYRAGAIKVYVEGGGTRMGRNAVSGPSRFVVELPSSATARAQCMKVAKAFRASLGNAASSPTDNPESQFLIIDLKNPDIRESR
jgi:hypothetical protein